MSMAKSINLCLSRYPQCAIVIIRRPAPKIKIGENFVLAKNFQLRGTRFFYIVKVYVASNKKNRTRAVPILFSHYFAPGSKIIVRIL